MQDNFEERLKRIEGRLDTIEELLRLLVTNQMLDKLEQDISKKPDTNVSNANDLIQGRGVIIDTWTENIPVFLREGYIKKSVYLRDSNRWISSQMRVFRDGKEILDTDVGDSSTCNGKKFAEVGAPNIVYIMVAYYYKDWLKVGDTVEFYLPL